MFVKCSLNRRISILEGYVTLSSPRFSKMEKKKKTRKPCAWRGKEIATLLSEWKRANQLNSEKTGAKSAGSGSLSSLSLGLDSRGLSERSERASRAHCAPRECGLTKAKKENNFRISSFGIRRTMGRMKTFGSGRDEGRRM